ncbi:class D beta-lactamase [Anaerospora sp.]|jgi:bla regulator protein BlaR1|uniref:class D beta-lactamase n=1 Tax=Anaerospora sp. TaxID=1960278 RepID=UPI0028A096BE|nr:class D beta-lactamase [Anaerospora sp.]
MYRYALLVLLTLFLQLGSLVSAEATSQNIRDDLGKYFQNYQGTFVLYDEAADQYTIYNEEQSSIRFSPCSTFKIPNSLIGLESGILEKENERTLLKWSGKQYSISAWNQDHTLATAMANSVVWYYQEVARKIGPERMGYFLQSLQYGNQDMSGGIDRFWLQSTLTISAKEQVAFIKKLYQNDLPFSQDNMALVRKLIILSTEKNVIFSGKTGSAMEDSKLVLGWFVGCVEKDGHRYFFATNITGSDEAFGARAKEISQQILTELAIL